MQAVVVRSFDRDLYFLRGDVKKDKTLSPGHQGWAVKSAYLEAPALSPNHLQVCDMRWMVAASSPGQVKEKTHGLPEDRELRGEKGPASRYLDRRLVYELWEVKAYPEHEDFSVVLALGDPQCSPVWTATSQDYVQDSDPCLCILSVQSLRR